MWVTSKWPDSITHGVIVGSNRPCANTQFSHLWLGPHFSSDCHWNGPNMGWIGSWFKHVDMSISKSSPHWRSFHVMGENINQGFIYNICRYNYNHHILHHHKRKEVRASCGIALFSFSPGFFQYFPFHPDPSPVCLQSRCRSSSHVHQ